MFFLWHISHLQRKTNVLAYGHGGIEPVVLKHHRNITILRLQIIDSPATHMNIAGSRLLKSRYQTHGGGLATTGRAKKHNKLLVFDIQIKIPDTHDVAPLFGQITKLNLGHNFS